MRLLLFTIIVIQGTIAYNQESIVGLTDNSPAYKSIVDVIMGDHQWYPGQASDHNAGFQYRLVVTRSEIYESIFLEKLAIDIEGGVNNVLWSKALNMNRFIEVAEVSSEQRHFSDIEWISPRVFESCVASFSFIFEIGENEKQVIVKKKESTGPNK